MLGVDPNGEGLLLWYDVFDLLLCDSLNTYTEMIIVMKCAEY